MNPLPLLFIGVATLWGAIFGEALIGAAVGSTLVLLYSAGQQAQE